MRRKHTVSFYKFIERNAKIIILGFFFGRFVRFLSFRDPPLPSRASLWADDDFGLETRDNLDLSFWIRLDQIKSLKQVVIQSLERPYIMSLYSS